MTQRASSPRGALAPETVSFRSTDADRFGWNSILPQRRPREIRRVGTIKAWHPRKNLGVVLDDGGTGNAVFTSEDVAPSDRNRIEAGMTVTYIAVVSQDGTVARQLRVDDTTLPPPTPDTFILKGWR
jgi:cold shock CspA family protein